MDNDAVHTAFQQYAQKAYKEKNISVGRYVVMPDHIHLFVRGDQSFTLAKWVGGLKRAISIILGSCSSDRVGRTVTRCSSRRIGGTYRIWQPGFFDHLMRSSESYAEKWAYVRQNPVRSSLVSNADEWPYQGEIVVIDRV